MSLNHPGCSLDTLKWFQSLTDTLAQWVEHHMQSQKVAGSIPASVTFPKSTKSQVHHLEPTMREVCLARQAD